MRRLAVGTLFSLGMAVGTVACGRDVTAPVTSRSLAAALVGQWSDTVSFPPGISLVMNLTAQDTTIAGSGTYSIEAGRSGTLAITGLVSDPDINLDVVYDYGPVMHFRGTIDAKQLLTGIWYAVPVGDPVGITFRKTR